MIFLSATGGGLVAFLTGLLLALTPVQQIEYVDEWTEQAEIGVDAEMLDEWHQFLLEHPESLEIWREAEETRTTAVEPVSRQTLSTTTVTTTAPTSGGLTVPGWIITNEAQWWKVGRWVPLLEAHFGDANIASCVLWGESLGDPTALHPVSGARGLMQILPRWADNAWLGTSGIAYSQFDDPETNIRVAKMLWDRQGWGAWAAYGRTYVQQCIAERAFADGYVATS